MERYLGAAAPVPPGWQPLSTLPLLILVGAMGAGKSTTVQALTDIGCKFRLLPNRRILTNLLIVAPLQREDKVPVQTLDRVGRLPYIRRFKQRHPAGLAHALSDLVIKPPEDKRSSERFLLFDGLRGEKEIRHTVDALPLAQFAMLETSTMVRIKRILARQDVYDQFSDNPGEQNPSPSPQELDSFATIGVSEAAGLLSTDEEQELLSLVRDGHASLTELRDKLRLILVERSLYKMEATLAALQTLAPDRTAFLNPAVQTPQQIAAKINSHLIKVGMV